MNRVEIRYRLIPNSELTLLPHLPPVQVEHKRHGRQQRSEDRENRRGPLGSYVLVHFWKGEDDEAGYTISNEGGSCELVVSSGSQGTAATWAS